MGFAWLRQGVEGWRECCGWRNVEKLLELLAVVGFDLLDSHAQQALQRVVEERLEWLLSLGRELSDLLLKRVVPVVQEASLGFQELMVQVA